MNLFRNSGAGLLVALAFALAGCGTAGDSAGRQPGVEQGAGGAAAGRGGGATAAGAGTGPTASGTRVNQPGTQAASEPGRGASGEWLGGPLGTLVIYFDYDRSSIRAEYGEVLRAHGAWLAANGNRRVVLEGHADERGTPEYNLALGSRRASTVAQALTALGAGSAQLATVSFGEEDPASEGANEIAWSKNRRVELVYETN